MSLQKIKELRKITSLGIVECKEALEKANGNVDKAIENLYSQGTIKYVKKDAQKLGFVNINVNEKRKNAVIIEFNTQTDFVSKNEQFLSFVKNVSKIALEKHINSIEDLLNEKFEGKYIHQHQSILINQFKENINISRLKYLRTETGVLGAYVHNNKIAVVVSIDKDLKKFAHDLAIHITAMKPEYLSVQDIEESRIEKEKNMLKSQIRDQHPNKPSDILEKIVEGKLNKLYQEIVLLKQIFVKDKNKNIENLLKENQCKITHMCRFEVNQN